MKIFLLFLIMSLLTGCSSKNTYTVDYELEIGSNYSEKITFYLPKNAYDIADESKDEDFANLEYNLLYTNIKSSFVNDNIYYNKKISKGLSQIKVQLDKKYTEHDFLYSQYINNCFEDYNLLSYKNNFDLKLFGEFYCYEDYDVNILLKTEYKILNTNGTKTNDGYVWKINKNNYLDTDISFSIERKYDELDTEIKVVEKENHLTKNIIGLVVGGGLLFVLVLIYKKYSK